MASETDKVDMGVERHELKIMAGSHNDPEDQTKHQPQCANDNVARVDSFHSLSPNDTFVILD